MAISSSLTERAHAALQLLLANLATDPRHGQLVERCKAQLEASHWNLVILGEGSSGKSVLVNRILGVPLMPTGMAPPTTPFLVTVLHGEPAAEVTEAGGAVRRGRLRTRHPEEVQQWLRQQALTEPLPLLAQVTWPIADGLRHVRLWDSPGVNVEGVSAASLLESIRGCYIDASIVTTPADRPLSETTVKLCQAVAGMNIPMLFVMTRADLASDGEERQDLQKCIAERIADKLGSIRPQLRREMGGNMEVYISGEGLPPEQEFSHGIERILSGVLPKADEIQAYRCEQVIRELRNQSGVPFFVHLMLWEIWQYLLRDDSQVLAAVCPRCSQAVSIERHMGSTVCKVCSTTVHTSRLLTAPCPHCGFTVRPFAAVCCHCRAVLLETQPRTVAAEWFQPPYAGTSHIPLTALQDLPQVTLDGQPAKQPEVKVVSPNALDKWVWIPLIGVIPFAMLLAQSPDGQPNARARYGIIVVYHFLCGLLSVLLFLAAALLLLVGLFGGN